MLPDTEQQIYRVPEDDLYLAGTSEVPLASLHAGEILAPGELPRRYAGFSTCFRREAGAAGKDTQGIFRVHQFDKVEMFSFVEPEQSGAEHERLLAIEEEILQALGIPYRVVNIAANDLGASAAKKYDLEAWLPGQERFRELTSCSNTTGFQARRLDIRHRPGGGRCAAARAHAQRHGGGGRPDDHRDRGEPPARRRHGGGAGGAPPVRRAERRFEGPAGRARPRLRPSTTNAWTSCGACPAWCAGGSSRGATGSRPSRTPSGMRCCSMARSSGTRSGGRTPRRCTATPGSTCSSTPTCTAAAWAPRRCACICTHLIDEHGFHRMVIDPEVDNEAAIACFRKVGFRPVGVMRRYIRDSAASGRTGC